MKKIIYIVGIMVFALSNSACKHNDIFNEVEFVVSTDATNTYLVGTPVKFNFEGDVDNIIVYDGTLGHEYLKKELYAFPIEEIKSCVLTIEHTKRTGSRPQSLWIHISDSFKGLQGPSSDLAIEEADKKTLQESVAEGAGVWVDLGLENVLNADWQTMNIDIIDYIENFCLGFERRTTDVNDIEKGQSAYWVKLEIKIKFNNRNDSTIITADQMKFNSFRLESKEDVEDIEGKRYLIGSKPGLTRYDGNHDLMFLGAPNNLDNDKGLTYPVNNWTISTPSALNPREADKANEVVKSFRDDLDSHSIEFKTAGTYIVTFVAGTTNYIDSESVVREIEVTIVDPPV